MDVGDKAEKVKELLVDQISEVADQDCDEMVNLLSCIAKHGKLTVEQEELIGEPIVNLMHRLEADSLVKMAEAIDKLDVTYKRLWIFLQLNAREVSDLKLSHLERVELVLRKRKGEDFVFDEFFYWAEKRKIELEIEESWKDRV